MLPSRSPSLPSTKRSFYQVLLNTDDQIVSNRTRLKAFDQHREERLWERTTGSRGWSTSSMSTWTRWWWSSWWLWQDQLFKNTQEILLHTFKSVTSTSCTTLNVRQKIIPMMLRLNYPLTWRYNTSPPGVSSMISQPCYVTTMSMSPPSSSRLQGEEPMHCGPSADRNKTGN